MAGGEIQSDAGRKSASRRAPVCLSIFAIAIVLLMCASAALSIRRSQGHALELAIARVPRGVTATEADRLVGGSPDDVLQASGVLINGATLLDASNPEAAKHGPITAFQIRRWKRGDVFGFVLIGEDGKVAGRLTMCDGLARRWGWHRLLNLVP
jgi:hypothetical protein